MREDTIESRLPPLVADAARVVLANMLGCDLDVTTSQDAAAPADDLVVVRVSLSGEFEGSVTIRWPHSTASSCAEALFGQPAEIGSAMHMDLLGELTNQIAGAAKAGLGLANVSMSTPLFVTDDRDLDSCPDSVLRCQSVHGQFEIAVATAHDRTPADGGPQEAAA